MKMHTVWCEASGIERVYAPRVERVGRGSL